MTAVRDLVLQLQVLTEAMESVPAHRREVLRLARRMEKATRPREARPVLPGEGTVAWAVLEALEANRRGYDHDHVRMLTGLTDAELAVRVTCRGGANSVRPRRVELARAGLVEPYPSTATANGTRWTISELGRRLLAEGAQAVADA